MKSPVLCVSTVALLGVGGIATQVRAGAGPQRATPIVNTLTTITDAVGGFLYLGCEQERIRIQELVLGITEERLLGIAHYSGVTEDGMVVEHTQFEPYRQLVYSVTDLRDFYMLDDSTDERVWIDAATCYVDANGNFGFSFLTGLDANGVAFSWTAQEECCSLVTKTKCIKEPSDPCSVSCPGPGAACVCSAPATGSCMTVMSQRCQGSCSTDCGGGMNQTCKGPFTNCHCE